MRCPLKRFRRCSAQNTQRKTFLEALEDIAYLVENGMLYADDSQVQPICWKGGGAVIKAMCLHVAHDCNMACKYCFGDTGAFDGARSLMSLEYGEAGN